MTKKTLSSEEIKQLYAKAKYFSRRYSHFVGIDPDDVLQDAMVRWLLRNPKVPRPVSWLYKTVRSVAYDVARSQRRESKYLARDASDYDDPIYERADEFGMVGGHRNSGEALDDDDHETRQRLVEVLKQLSAELRDVLMLTAEARTYAEIAEITGVSIGTVRSRLHYARKQAKMLMQ
jgi:RNA polymerase sigma-70 factor (ECF subfamily)